MFQKLNPTLNVVGQLTGLNTLEYSSKVRNSFPHASIIPTQHPFWYTLIVVLLSFLMWGAPDFLLQTQEGNAGSLPQEMEDEKPGPLLLPTI